MTNEEIVKDIQNNKNVVQNKVALYKNMRNYIYKIASKYKWFEDVDDLKQEGYLGMEKAIYNYNPEKGAFSTYASDWIESYIQRYISNNRTTARIPVHMWDKMRNYNKAVRELEQCGEVPTTEKIADRMGVSVGSVETIKESIEKQYSASLNAKSGEEEDQEAINLIADPINLEEQIINNIFMEELKTALWGCVDELPGAQSIVIRKHYQDNIPCKDIAVLLKITSSKAYNLKKQAINNLRYGGLLAKLKPYMDDIQGFAVQGNGIGSYARSWTSSTEKIVLQRERYNELMGEVLAEMQQLQASN
jgi:RNA polymerase sigma factor (sigma-70 family)